MSYQSRLGLFHERLEAVRLHNLQPHRSWIAGLNRFADYSDEEFQALLGHRPSHRGPRSSSSSFLEAAWSSSSSSFLEVKPHKSLAGTVDWRQKLKTVSDVKDQGACGSCWAVAAIGALESHAEMSGLVQPLSFEQLVDCVENPKQCGGSGGCKGATSELAFEWVMKHGLVAASDYQGYMTGGDGSCRTTAQPAIAAAGMHRLIENRLQPLMEAVAERGPVVVSVDAGGWNMYQAGVYDSCSIDATVNHAVVAVGYGTDAELKKDYWLIRNSWGPVWGESGYIRLLRHSGDISDADPQAGFCGTDFKPQEGVGCKDSPSTVKVCGMCGVLSDSSYPVDVKVVASQ